MDAGTPSTYLQVQLDLVDGVRGPAERAVDPSAEVGDGAELAHSVVMAGAQIASGAVVRDSVVLPGARIETGATVEGSVVGSRAVVESGASVRHLCVIGQDVVVRAGTALEGAKVPEDAPA